MLANITGVQYGKFKGGTKSQYYSGLSDLTERFYCCRLDDHTIEGQDDLIPPCACAFSKFTPHILAVADEEGGLVTFDTRKSGIHAIKQDWRVHNNAIFDIEWMPNCNNILTGSGDQTVVLSDVAKETKIGTFKGHKSSVKNVEASPDCLAVFGTGSRDGNVMIWDTRTQPKRNGISAVNVICRAHPEPVSNGSTKKRRTPSTPKSSMNSDRQHPVTGLAYLDEYNIVSAGTNDGVVKIWDLRKTHTSNKNPIAKMSFAHPKKGKSNKVGFSCLQLDSSRTRLFASSKDHVIYEYNCTNFNVNPVRKYRGHENGSFYIRTAISPDDLFLLSGSTDCNAYIWRLDSAHTYPVVLKSHRAEVSSAAWCPTDISKLVTISDDTTVKIWRFDQSTMPIESGPIVGTSERVQQSLDLSLTASPRQSLPVSMPGVTPLPPSPQIDPRSPRFPPQSPRLLPNSPRTIPTSPLVTNSQVTPHKVNFPKDGQLLSPAITKWFCRNVGPKIEAEVKPPTPKKLRVIFSPKKPPPPGSPRVIEPNPDSSPEKTIQQVRRKLDSLSSPVRRSPRRCALRLNIKSPEKENFRFDSSDSDHCIREDYKKALFMSTNSSPLHSSSSNNTPLKRVIDDAVSSHLSPTANLPNLVMDPPRTPTTSSIDLVPTKSPTPNWLVQLKAERQSSGKRRVSSSGDSEQGCRTPERSSKKSLFDDGDSITPPPTSKRRKLTPKISRASTPKTPKEKSILTYFSPQGTKKQ